MTMDGRIYLTRQYVLPMELRDCDFRLIIEALKEKKARIQAYINIKPEDTARCWEITRLIQELQDLQLKK